MERDAVVDLAKYQDQKVRVRFQGGREVEGVLKGFDKLDNLVIDDCVEFLRDPTDPYKTTEQTRNLGLVVCRGPQLSLISPSDGMEQIENPFAEDDVDEGDEPDAGDDMES
jgi:U6 snRNA-associated Sm-like protein LSm7